MQRDSRTTIVVATRDRAADLARTLEHLTALPSHPPIVVVDNRSSDDTVDVVRRRFPHVTLLPLAHNAWGAARNVGAREARTPYIAFSDDDSWWSAGSLSRAADLFDAHARLGLIAGRVLVGRDEAPDPTTEVMTRSPLPQTDNLDRPGVLGFLACGCIVRREAFLAAGGFNQRLEIGGEEELLALDLASAGWGLHYAHDVVAHHHPSGSRDRIARKRRQTRNALWSAWLRYPARAALAVSARELRHASHDRASLLGSIDSIRGLPWIARERRSLTPRVARALDRLQSSRPPEPGLVA